MLTCRHRVVSSMSCLGTLVALVACALADESLEEKRVVLKDGDRIIFFGDSLTALAGQEAPSLSSGSIASWSVGKSADQCPQIVCRN